MATVNVRRLDDEVVSRLKHRASSNNRSLESEIRHILEGAVADDREARRDAFRLLSSQLRVRTAGTRQTPSEVLVRQDRNSGHHAGHA
ncbi:MAG: Arc family DNA-binding protein [Chloroflexi bacterium]|nr:Arc family DNA-binding protein [Chloroflexota bacterium]